MAIEFDFTSPADKPALLAISSPRLMAEVRDVLTELGYAVHPAANHEDFLARFSQVQYQLVVVEELFSAAAPAENKTLLVLQNMPMPQRRHAVVILVGESFLTRNALQAFQQSVHAVVQSDDMPILPRVIQQAVAENSLFLNTYRETQLRIAQGKL